MSDVLEFLAGRPLVVLTGAGVSTDSGIPDYRGPNTPARQPMTWQEFTSGPEGPRRYWARSHIGWRRIGRAEPNDGHRALARMEAEERVRLLITQNVDGLHEAAGSHPVALHGRLAEVVCLGCRTVTSRSQMQARLEAFNPTWTDRHATAESLPDGDVVLEDSSAYRVPPCEECDGVLKPDVVFFGENAPPDRVQRCFDAVDALATDGALLVAGSSLAIMSGLRFVRRAAKNGTPVVIVNRGTTRGDDLAAYVVDSGTTEFLTALADS